MVIYKHDENFFQLVNFTDDTIEKELLDREEAFNWLLELERSKYNNSNAYDLINYEKLITIECIHSRDPEIMDHISCIKADICDNYIYRNKLLKRYILNKEVD